MSCWRRSTTGLLKDLTRPTCRRLRRCWTRWDNAMPADMPSPVCRDRAIGQLSPCSGASAGGGAMMDFFEVLDQVIDLLRSRGRVSYRALRLQFNLDDDALEALKEELIEVQQLASDQDGKMLRWAGEAVTGGGSRRRASSPAAPRPIEAERRQLTVLLCDLVDSAAAGQPARSGRVARGGAGLSRDLRQGDRTL